MKRKNKFSHFFKGMGSVLNLGGNYYKPRIKSDRDAIAEVWAKVGGDMRKAMEQFEAENPEVVKKVKGKK